MGLTILKMKSFTLHLPVLPSCYPSPGIKYKSRSQNLLRKIPRDHPNQTGRAYISKVNKCFSSHSRRLPEKMERVRPRGERCWTGLQAHCGREQGTASKQGTERGHLLKEEAPRWHLPPGSQIAGRRVTRCGLSKSTRLAQEERPKDTKMVGGVPPST